MSECRFTDEEGFSDEVCLAHPGASSVLCTVGLAALRARVDEAIAILTEWRNIDSASAVAELLAARARIEALEAVLGSLEVAHINPAIVIKHEGLRVFFYYSDLTDRDGAAREVLTEFEERQQAALTATEAHDAGAKE